MISLNEQKLFNIINESILDVFQLNEYHDEPRLPLYGNGHALMDEFIDWLQYSSAKGKLPKPKITWEQGLKKGCYDFISSEKDEKVRKTKSNTLYERIINNEKFLKGVQFDENGNLYVEREIYIGNGRDINLSSPKMFDDLIRDYEDNVGGCWCYLENGSMAYCGDNVNSSVTVTLKGYMFLDDIYWAELIRKEVSDINEYEVRTYPRGRVMLTDIVFRDNNGTYKGDSNSFDGPRILKQTYFGNNSKFDGDFATIGLEGIGYDKQYIDRKGNEYTKNDMFDMKIHDFITFLQKGADPRDYNGNVKFSSVWRVGNDWSLIGVRLDGYENILDANKNYQPLFDWSKSIEAVSKSNSSLFIITNDGLNKLVDRDNNKLLGGIGFYTIYRDSLVNNTIIVGTPAVSAVMDITNNSVIGNRWFDEIVPVPIKLDNGDICYKVYDDKETPPSLLLNITTGKISPFDYNLIK